MKNDAVGTSSAALSPDFECNRKTGWITAESHKNNKRQVNGTGTHGLGKNKNIAGVYDKTTTISQ